jgi:hypothetical protein
VHVLYNGLAIFDGKVAGFGEGSGPTYDSDVISVSAGDTIDFTVGYGDDGNHGYDSTRLDSVVSFWG